VVEKKLVKICPDLYRVTVD